MWKCTFSGCLSGIPVSRYVSEDSGLQVYLARVNGPTVHGHYALATETHDDFGCPHTLEHLVFMGSEDYPFKGVLDKLANRSLSRGTNAWTDVDSTVYTQSNAGAEGFLQLLPVYLDHILFPRITDEAFLTEVHHINGEGEDAGVVYCEMQARENAPFSVCYRTLMKSLFERTGYASETGGMLEPLRRLTVEQVRNYHRQYYRPNNLGLIITGNVEPQELFTALEPLNKKIKSKNWDHIAGLSRVWDSPVPAFTGTQMHNVDFPAVDEEGGAQVFVGYRAPGYVEFEKLLALRILSTYLAASPVSPLQKAFVHNDDPWCSEVGAGGGTQSESSTIFMFMNFVSAKLPLFAERFCAVLRESKTSFDLNRMRTNIHQKRIRFIESLESDPHNQIAHLLIPEFLYGPSVDHMNVLIRQADILEELEGKSAAYWIDLLDEYLVDKPACIVLGRPSAESAASLQLSESERLQAQKEALGSDALATFQNNLERAMASNEVPCPDELLGRFQIPSVENISFFPITTHLQKDPEFGIDCHIDEMNSGIYRLTVLCNSDDVPEDLRDYLELFLDCIMQLPLKLPDAARAAAEPEQLSHEDVVRKWNEETLTHSNGAGFGGSTNFTCGLFGQLLTFGFSCEPSKLASSSRLLAHVLFHSVFDKERILISVNRLLNDCVQAKRDGGTMCSAGVRHMMFSLHSNHRASQVVRQECFLQSILESISKGADFCDEVIAKLRDFRAHLLRPNFIRVYVAGPCSSLDALSQSIRFLLQSISKAPASTSLSSSDPSWSSKFTSWESRPKNVAIAIASLESAYMNVVVPGPTLFSDPDIPSLLVLVELLTGSEGPFWTKIRGMGLSYSYGIRVDPEAGSITFVLFKSGSPVQALEQAKTIVHDLVSGKTAFDELALESAKAAVYFSYIEREDTVASSSMQRLMNSYRKVSVDNFTHERLAQISRVCMQDVMRVLTKWIHPMFSNESAAFRRVAFTSSPANAQKIIDGVTDLVGSAEFSLIGDHETASDTISSYFTKE
eukprot:ANDGO_08127.mRNA.1 Uncharacterized protein YOL098C